MIPSRHEDVSAFLDGRLTLSDLVSRHGVSAAEVSEWIALYQAGRARNRRRAWVGGLALVLVLVVFSSRDVLAQVACSPVLPSGFVTFCPGQPAKAADVNGNFLAAIGYVDTRVGPASAGQVTTTRVGASSGTLQIQTVTSGTTQFGGVVQLAGNSTTDSSTCNAGAAGSLRVYRGSLEVCQRNRWSVVHAVPTDGSTLTCKDIKNASPGAPSGTYLLAAGGYAFKAECDMNTDSGGWTLAQGHALNTRTVEGLSLTSGSGLLLPAGAFRALAKASTQIRLADAGGSVITQANSAALTQLRDLKAINSVNGEVGLWTYSGSLTSANFTSTCGTVEIYPSTVHSCGNTGGAHVMSANHSLRNSAGVDTLGLWLR